ncbi:MAG: T9SS type A sorting domain-containing protein [Bacteroidota bacterium]
MNRKSLTKLPRLRLFDKALLLFFTLSLFGTFSANAQVLMNYAKNDTTCTTHKLAVCNGEPSTKSIRFTDDGTNDSNYADPTGHQRRDTTEFCPTDAWHRVKAIFTDFDVEVNDSLVVFNGKKSELRGPFTSTMDSLTRRSANRIGAGSGTGVAQAYGGWVTADCDPLINKTGCLTFIFYTDGNNTKGKGFDAWVDCEARNIELGNINIANRKLTCDSSAYGVINIPAPEVKMCGEVMSSPSDSVIVRVSNQHGMICIDTCLTRSGTMGGNSVSDTFGIGSYVAVYKLKSDTTKTKSVVFSVQAPSLVCNDEVRVPLGSACMVVLKPDDVLENPCDTVTDTMYYNITVTLGTGKTQQVLTTKNFNNGNPVEYPVITKEAIRKAGMTVCGAKATVRIERIYYGTTDMLTFCNNGVKSSACETTMNIFDHSIPWITVDADCDTLVACDTTGLGKIISAKAIDNCDEDINVTFTVRLDETDPCFNTKGKRDTTTAFVTFTAVDDCGNVGTKMKEYTIIRPNKQDHIVKTRNVKEDCSAIVTGGAEVPGLKLGVVKNNQFIARDTVRLSTNDYICGYILTKDDEVIPATDCGSKSYRYWYLVDWCQPELGPVACDTTFIEYIDTIAPMFAMGEGQPLHLELGHFDCTYDLTTIPRPKATDNCDANPLVRIDSVFRIEDGIKWGVSADLLTKLDCDSFCVRWVAQDKCHEQLKNDTLLQIVNVKDVTPPSASCTDRLIVSLASAKGARIFASEVDAGSYDACGIAQREIRIKGTGAPWGDSLDIGCEFVHPDLQVELRVTDLKGNSNICWLDITVEDKIPPACENLPPTTRFCDEFHNGELGETTDADGDKKFDESEWKPLSEKLQLVYNQYFGAFQCEDNLTVTDCGVLTSEEEYQLIEWPCGEIEIKRRHRAVDWSGNKSNNAFQDVKVAYRAGWKFTLPDDWEGKCESTLIPPALTIENGACDLLGYEVTSKLFEVPGDACFKMERTYHIINWCKYVAGTAPVEIARVEGDHGFAKGFMVTSEGNENNGYWTYVQVLKVHDDVAPVVTIQEPDPCINAVEFDAPPYGEEDQTPGFAPFECDEVKTWTATAVDCTDSMAISWEGRLIDANTGNIVKEVKTNTISYVVSNKESYFAQFWAYDGCGNAGTLKGEPVKFWDCKKPTPYLLNGIAIEIMETGMIEVWASDLNQGTFDNCTDQANIDLRIWHRKLGPQPTDKLGVLNLPKVLEFTCLEVGTQNVHIYAIDEEQNWDFAITYVIVQDNMQTCLGFENNGNRMVAGTIQNANGVAVQSVGLAVNGTEQKTMTTAADGHYQFMLPEGGDYTVTPEKDINPLNGVSTFDLVLISKHILGITPFESPYQHIAADINQSGTITAFDMVQLRQLILNLTTEFPNNTSWRFVEADFDFNMENPAAASFGEFISINNLADNMEQLDFTAVKIGDVNGNATANNLQAASSRNATQTLHLNVVDRFVEAGETVTIPFSAADMTQASGYQFTLKVAGEAMIEEGVAKATNFNLQSAERGIIATSWNGTAAADELLFAVTFTANTTGLLSEMVSLSSEVTTAEAYSTDGELMNVALNFATESTAEGFVLQQNTPNPFRNTTLIGFQLPNAGTATLTILDVQGKVLQQITNEFAKGYNTFEVNAQQLNATGIMYYQLESADNVATKKMIILE